MYSATQTQLNKRERLMSTSKEPSEHSRVTRVCSTCMPLMHVQKMLIVLRRHLHDDASYEYGDFCIRLHRGDAAFTPIRFHQNGARYCNY